MHLEKWALRHNVPLVALQELRAMFGHTPRVDVDSIGLSEAAVQSRVRLAVSRTGERVFRNNNGAGKLSDGSFVRWGLANDSQQLNDKLKSSDLIGIRPVLVAPEHVGLTIGQFTSYEVKHAGWAYAGTPREVAQDAWLRLIVSLGGYARFVTDERGIDDGCKSGG